MRGQRSFNKDMAGCSERLASLLLFALLLALPSHAPSSQPLSIFESSSDFRAQLTTRVEQEVAAARAEAIQHAQRQIARQVAAMRSRAQETFAPWIVDFGQTVRTEPHRAGNSVAASNFGAETNNSMIRREDALLVRSHFESSVATQQHFSHLMRSIERQAARNFDRNLELRLAEVRDEFGIATRVHTLDREGIPGTRADTFDNDLHWATTYLEHVESVIKSDTMAPNRSLGDDALKPLYQGAFALTLRRLVAETPSNEVPPELRSTLSALSEDASLTGFAAASTVSWYVANLSGSREQKVAEMRKIFEVHYQSLMHEVLMETEHSLLAQAQAALNVSGHRRNA